MGQEQLIIKEIYVEQWEKLTTGFRYIWATLWPHCDKIMPHMTYMLSLISIYMLNMKKFNTFFWVQMKNRRKKNILAVMQGLIVKPLATKVSSQISNQFYIYGLQCDSSCVKYGTNLIKTFDKYDKYHIFHFVGVPGLTSNPVVPKCQQRKTSSPVFHIWAIMGQMYNCD